MKDCYSPAGTPLVLSNALNTPSGTDANHYFASSHQLLRVQDGAGSRASSSSSGSRKEDSNEALSKKLRSLQVGRYTSLIDSIPNELLSLIVELGFFDFADAEGFSPDVDFRSTALQISQRFRQVALCTPTIWSVYHVSQGNIRSQLRHELPANLPRSKEYPLDIRLSCFWDACYTEGLMKLLVPYSKRWRRLSIVTMNANVFEFLQHVPVPLLEELDISFYSHERRTSLPLNIFDDGRTPRLSSLCLRNVNLTDLPFALRNLTTLEIRGYGTWPEFEQFSEMLSGSTSLEKLVLHVKPGHVVHQQLFPVLADSSSNNHHHAKGQIILPELRVFEVYTSEWLSSGIVSLINVFSCPKLESLVLREGVGSASETARTIMSYTAQPHLHRNPAQLPYPVLEPVCNGFPNRLFVQSASLSLACRSFPASLLTSLELRRVMLPSHMSMKQAFSSLKNLKHLYFFDVSPNEGILQMLDNVEPVYFQEKMVQGMESTIPIPSLETLMLGFRHCAVAVDPLGKDYSAAFIRTFSLPALRSLVLKDLTLSQWKSIADVFEAHAEEYPQLTSLKLIDVNDILPTNTDHPSYCSLTRSFPYLRRLSLDGVTCNQVLRELLSASSSSFTIPTPPDRDDAADVVFACPHLEVLSICNDSNVSKPLLHRLVSSRMDAGRPLRRLYLDEHFSKNGDSWDWLKEKI
ncbi:hypothetical protein CPC08DRAFT_397164 [Agrocybe pediades]|nr:hypothetical protein CPC08DRAFT_397164 [Agrocybe pediades]